MSTKYHLHEEELKNNKVVQPAYHLQSEYICTGMPGSIQITTDNNIICVYYDIIRIWNIESKSYNYFKLPCACNPVFSLSSDDTHIAASGGTSSKIYIFNIRTGVLVKSLECNPKTIVLTYSPDGTRIASVSKNGVIQITDVKSGKCIKTITSYKIGKKMYGKIEYSPNGAYIGVFSEVENAFAIYDVENNKCICESPHNIFSFTFSPDSTSIIYQTNTFVFHTLVLKSLCLTSHTHLPLQWARADEIILFIPNTTYMLASNGFYSDIYDTKTNKYTYITTFYNCMFPYVTWSINCSPSGKYIVFVDCSGKIMVRERQGLPMSVKCGLLHSRGKNSGNNDDTSSIAPIQKSFVQNKLYERHVWPIIFSYMY